MDWVIYPEEPSEGISRLCSLEVALRLDQESYLGPKRRCVWLRFNLGAAPNKGARIDTRVLAASLDSGIAVHMTLNSLPLSAPNHTRWCSCCWLAGNLAAGMNVHMHVYKMLFVP